MATEYIVRVEIEQAEVGSDDLGKTFVMGSLGTCLGTFETFSEAAAFVGLLSLREYLDEMKATVEHDKGEVQQ